MQKSVYVDRLLKFLGVIVSQAKVQSQANLVALLVVELAEFSEAEDHIARWRACQALQQIMDNICEDIDLGDEVLEKLQAAMLCRLDDIKPAVRAAAARALKRLPVPDEVQIISLEY